MRLSRLLRLLRDRPTPSDRQARKPRLRDRVLDVVVRLFSSDTTNASGNNRSVR